MPCEGRCRWRKGVIAGHVGCVYAHKACDCEARCKTHADVDGCRDETAPGDDCIDNPSTRHDIIARLTRARLVPSALHRGPSLRLVYAHKRRAPRRRCLDAHRFRDGYRRRTSSSASQTAHPARECAAGSPTKLIAATSAEFMRTNSAARRQRCPSSERAVYRDISLRRTAPAM